MRAAISRPAAAVRARARSSIAAIDVDADDVIAVPGERHRDPARPDGELDDRAAGSPREGPVQVDVARILAEVEVVQARDRRGERFRIGHAADASGRRRAARRFSGRRRPSIAGRSGWPAVNRTFRPSRCLTASAEMASSAQRFAIIAVDSAQSYGGETSTMSMPASSTLPTIRRTARSSSRGSSPPGSGVPVPGAEPGSTTSMSTDR